MWKDITLKVSDSFICAICCCLESRFCIMNEMNELRTLKRNSGMMNAFIDKKRQHVSYS